MTKRKHLRTNKNQKQCELDCVRRKIYLNSFGKEKGEFGLIALRTVRFELKHKLLFPSDDKPHARLNSSITPRQRVPRDQDNNKLDWIKFLTLYPIASVAGGEESIKGHLTLVRAHYVCYFKQKFFELSLIRYGLNMDYLKDFQRKQQVVF